MKPSVQLLRMSLIVWIGLLSSAPLRAQPVETPITFDFLPDDATNNPLLSGDYLPSSSAIVENSTATLLPRADWLDKAWAARMQIVITNSGGQKDEFPVAVTLGPQLATFWARLRSASGDEIRVTTADGKTLVPHFLEDFRGKASSRTCANVGGLIYSRTTLPGTYDLDKKNLVYRVGGDPNLHTVTFKGNGLTLANIVAQINATKNVLIQARQSAGYLMLRSVIRREYHYQVQIVIDLGQAQDAATILGFVHAPYTANSLSTPSALESPCLNLWFRAPTLAPGANSFWIYFDNPDKIASTSDELAVFSYSTPQPIYHYLSYLNADVTNFDLWVASFVDGATLQLGTTPLTLDAGFALSLATSKAGFVQPLSTAPFTILADLDAADALVPISFASTEFFYPSVRSTNQFYVYSPAGKAKVIFEEHFYENGAPQTGATKSVEIAEKTVVQVDFDVVDANPPRVVLIKTACADGDGSCTAAPSILVEHRTSERNDTHPFHLAVDDLWGITSGAGYIAAMTPDTVISAFVSDNANGFGPTIYQPGQSVVIGGGIGQGRGDGLHVFSTTHPINGLRAADSDGGEANIFLPYFELGSRYLISRPAQYLSIATTWPQTSCTLRWGSCANDTDCGGTAGNGVTCSNGRCQLTKSDEVQNSYPSPGLIYFGADNPACPCSEGMVCQNNRCLYPISDSGTQTSDGRTLYRAIELSCSDRVFAYLEDSGNDDEKTLLPAKSHRKPSFGPAPLQDFGATHLRYVPNVAETVELPTIQPSGVTIAQLQLLSEKVTAPGNTTIRYQLRVDGGAWMWATDQGLVVAQNLTEANTLAELQNVIFAPEAMTVQLRVVLTSTSGANAPVIDALTVKVVSGGTIALDGTNGDDGDASDVDDDTSADDVLSDVLSDDGAGEDGASDDGSTSDVADNSGVGDLATPDLGGGTDGGDDATGLDTLTPDDTNGEADTGGITVIRPKSGGGCRLPAGEAPIDTSLPMIVFLLFGAAVVGHRLRKRRSAIR